MSTLTPEKAQEAIQFYLGQLGSLVGTYATAAEEKATTEANYRIAIAGARLEYRDRAARDGLKSTDSVVDDIGTVETADLLRRRLLAAGKEESTKAALRATQSKLDGARSLAANLREVI